MSKCLKTVCLTLVGLWWVGQPVNQASSSGPALLDPNLPIYRPVERIKGELKLGGSNTLSHVAAVWIASFQEFYPDAKITIEVKGSRAAIDDVKAGKADIGLLSRRVREDEIDSFQETFGYPPTVLTPCLERTAIYVHKDNPVKGLTLAELDAIFSTECKRGAKEPYRKWGQLGLKGSWASRPIVVHGRTMDTGSQVFLQEAILLGGAMREDIVAHQSNIDIIQDIAKNPAAIGFAGLSYATPEVRAVPLALAEGEDYIAIDSPEADRGAYPMVRRLQLVVKHDPKLELRPIEREFIKYVFSTQGQEDVVKAGFQAIPAQPALVALDAVGLGLSR
jgi:phosphate transport system substrate-binding protein